MSRANLVGANMARANLLKASLRESNLVGACLMKANLTEANLSHVNLEKANLTEATLTLAILSGADLTSAILTRANLSYANLKRAILRNADLRETELRKVELEGADLDGAAELIGQVVAGEGDLIYEAELYEGRIYRFEVVGDSMKHKGIQEGDHIVVQVSSEWPAEGEIIVTTYLPSGVPVVIGNESKLLGPTVKIYQGELGDKICLLQGWEEKRKIRARIWPIGKVVAVCPALREPSKREWWDFGWK